MNTDYFMKLFRCLYLKCLLQQVLAKSLLFWYLLCDGDLLLSIQNKYFQTISPQFSRPLFRYYSLYDPSNFDQCDQMARLFKKYLAICNYLFNLTLMYSITFLPQIWSNFYQILNKPSKMSKTFKMLPKWRNFAKSGHTDFDGK